MKVIHIVGSPPLYTNNYLVISEQGNAVLIDPAADLSEIDKQLRENDAALTHVFLTHGHHDHVETLAEVVEKYNPKVYMNQADALAYNIKADVFFEDFGTVALDELVFETIFTPGHTKGSTIIICGDHMFTGDTLFAGSIGRTDFMDGDSIAMRKSLEKILEHVTDDKKVLPGHDVFSTMETERKRNPYLRV